MLHKLCPHHALPTTSSHPPTLRCLQAARAPKKGCELAPATAPEGLEIATVAGGCFWGLELGERRRRVAGALRLGRGLLPQLSHCHPAAALVEVHRQYAGLPSPYRLLGHVRI